jgi:hypothetical protein
VDWFDWLGNGWSSGRSCLRWCLVSLWRLGSGLSQKCCELIDWLCWDRSSNWLGYWLWLSSLRSQERLKLILFVCFLLSSWLFNNRWLWSRCLRNWLRCRLLCWPFLANNVLKTETSSQFCHRSISMSLDNSRWLPGGS